MSNNQTATGSARPQATTFQRRVRSKRRHVVRNVGYAVIMLIGFAAVAKFAAERIQLAASSEEAPPVNANEVRVGSITQQTDKERCELVKFDNYSGRTIENSRHCETTVVRDARGIPVPVGTVHRLDSISKSFLGDNR